MTEKPLHQELAELRAKIEQQRLRIEDLEINSPAQAALDEIERLTAALDFMEKRAVRKEEEIARLQAELDDRTGLANVRMMDQNAEIARLTMELDRWQHDALGWSDRLTEATNEVERLREYADHKPNCRVGYGMYCTCGLRRALEAKP